MGLTPRILIADDNPHILWLVQMHLELRGHQVLLAADGQTTVEMAIAESPDLIILDVEMPVMDGYTACQRIRTFSDVPIIMLSGLDRDQDRVRGLDMGADQYLVKPCAMQELVARVEALLRRVQYAFVPPQDIAACAPAPFYHEND